MPELPDVELFKRYLDSRGLDKIIEKVDIRTEQVLGDLQPEDLKTALPELIARDVAKGLKRSRFQGEVPIPVLDSRRSRSTTTNPVNSDYKGQFLERFPSHS